MNGVSAMVREAEQHLTDVMDVISARDLDGDWIRKLNEEIAIIQGLTEMLTDPAMDLDGETARAAVDAIARHAAGLRELLKHS